MAIPALAARIEQRLAELQQEIDLLQAADEALATTSIEPAAADPAAETLSRQRQDREAAPTRAAVRHGHCRGSQLRRWRWRSRANWTLACATGP